MTGPQSAPGPRLDLFAHARPFVEPGPIIAKLVGERPPNAVDVVDLDAGPRRGRQADQKAHGPTIIARKIEKGGIVLLVLRHGGSGLRSAGKTESKARQGKAREGKGKNKARKRLAKGRPNRFLDRASMPPSATRAMVEAVGDGLLRDIVNDRRTVMVNAPPKPTPTPVSAQNTSGWRNAQPLGPPPGVAQADKLMDAQDAKDRAE